MINRNLSSLKKSNIGYSPYSLNYMWPGDRRRFCFFAKEAGLSYSLFDLKKSYDIVLLSSIADLSKVKYIKKNGSKVIIDLVDSYLIRTNPLKDRLRYLGRSLKHKNYLNALIPKKFTDHLKSVLSIADGIICTTNEQKKAIQVYNSNVHEILDNMDDDVFKANVIKSKKKNQINILWEGLPSNLINFKEIVEALNLLGSKLEVNLHIVTDLIHYRYLSNFHKINTIDIVNKYPFKINTFIYQWNKLCLSSMAANCDLAIIPIDQNNNFVLGKPENKLTLLWKLGLPVYTSFTASYFRTMKKAGVNMICNSKEDWVCSLLNFHKMSDKNKKELSDKLKEYANNNYTKELLIQKWSNLFASVN